MQAQVSNQRAGAVARSLQALSAGAAKRGESAICRKIQGLSAFAGGRAVGALVNPILGNARAAQYRTGLLVGYLLNQGGFDGVFCIQNCKSAPLKLRWCLWGKNGERLIPIQNVTPDIPPGHEGYIAFSMAAPGKEGVAALWDSERMDDGVEDRFTGWQLLTKVGFVDFYGVQNLLKVRDLRGQAGATRKQFAHNSYNNPGIDTGLIFINPNHAYADFPGGTLTGIVSPQCSVTPANARFYGDDGTEFDLVAAAPVFPLHAYEVSLISDTPPFRGAHGETLSGRSGVVEYVLTGDIEGLYFEADWQVAWGYGLAEMAHGFEI